MSEGRGSLVDKALELEKMGLKHSKNLAVDGLDDEDEEIAKLRSNLEALRSKEDLVEIATE